MTTFERFEREIPELMAELAPTRVPDYFDDMLRLTAGTRQRPAWSALERWLPMGVIALSAPTRRVPWRHIAVVGAVLLIVAASLAYSARAERPCHRCTAWRATASSSTARPVATSPRMTP